MKLVYLSVALAVASVSAKPYPSSQAEETNRVDFEPSLFSSFSTLLGQGFARLTTQAEKSIEKGGEDAVATNDAQIPDSFVHQRFRAWAESHGITFAGQDEESHRFGGESWLCYNLSVVGRSDWL